MRDIFYTMINVNILGSYFILAVIVVRFFLRRAPKSVICFLWILAGIRFLIPFSLESVFSLVPSGKIVRESGFYENLPVVNTGIQTADLQINQYLIRNYDMASQTTIMQPVMAALGYVWFAGMLLMLGYFFISWYLLKRRVSMAVPEEIFGEKVYRCSTVSSPFLLGVIKPRIYLPDELQGKTLFLVIAHEKAHKERYDHLIKPAACILLIVYWFNPLLWIAYILLCRDIEYACDERVIRKLGEGYKKEYSSALLSCSIEKRKPSFCPVAFGEAGVKDRILKILNYKKPAVWGIAAAVFICALTVLCFMTQKKEEKPGGSIIEYDGYQMILESAVICEETDGARIDFRVIGDKSSGKKPKEFGNLISPGISGSKSSNMITDAEYEFFFAGFCTEDMQQAMSLRTGDGVEVGSFPLSLAEKDEVRFYEIDKKDSGIGNIKIAVSTCFAKIELEGEIPDKKDSFTLVMDRKRGERWKISRIPIQVGAPDTASYDHEIWIQFAMQDEEKGIIWLAFEEPVNLDDIQGFSVVSNQ